MSPEIPIIPSKGPVMENQLKIIAEMKVLPKGEWRHAHAISKGYRSNLFYLGNYYPSIIVECDGQIEPGGRTKVTLLMIDPVQRPSELSVGAMFELKEGPSVVAAKCRAVSISVMTD